MISKKIPHLGVGVAKDAVLEDGGTDLAGTAVIVVVVGLVTADGFAAGDAGELRVYDFYALEQINTEGQQGNAGREHHTLLLTATELTGGLVDFDTR